MIICDTREKKNRTILKYFDSHRIPYVEKKLETGDYMNSDKMDVIIDRKQNLGEILKNLCSPDKSRFWKEIRRAHQDKVRFIILCEHGGPYKSLKDVVAYKDKFSKVSGRKLMDMMIAAQMAYGVEYEFCAKGDTGRRIVELLGV